MEGISVNSNMQNSHPVVGEIIPPNKVGRCVLYSDKEASSTIRGARYDVYTNTKKISFEDRFSTPKSVFYVLGLSALALVCPSAVKFFKKVFKK